MAKRFQNGIEVEQELRNFNDKLNQARLPKLETIMTLKTVSSSIYICKDVYDYKSW